MAGALALMAGLAGCGGGGLPDGVAARVGNQDIATSEIDRAVDQQKAAAEQQGQDFPDAGTEEYAALRRQALEGILLQRIILLEAEECGRPCLATPRQIAAERKKVITTNFSGDAAKFDEFRREQGLSAPDVDRILRVGIEEPRVTARVTKGITYTPAQALGYCRANPAEFRKPASRTASHILLKTKAEADSVRARVSSSNFADLARRYSIDPGSRSQGGSLGAITKGALVPEFEKVAFALGDGEISDPVRTQFGYHIITVTLSPGRDIPCPEAEAGIIRTQIGIKRNEAIQKWRDEVTKKWETRTTYADDALKPTSTTAGR